MNLFRPFYLCLLSLVLIHNGHAAGLDAADLAPPEVVDIDDPFSRDIKREADDITGNINFDDQNLRIDVPEDTGKALLGRESIAAAAASRFRILGLAVTKKVNNNEIYVSNSDEVAVGSKPLLNYLRIGHHPDIDTARQQAINLKSSYGDYLDASFVIRNREGGSDLDIGPFATIPHAERYCDMLLEITFGLVGDCYAIQTYPKAEDTNSFTSKAMIKFSPDAIQQVIGNPAVFNLPETASQILTVSEGDSLGTGSTLVTKIIPSGIIIVDEVGNLAKLPLTYIPENSFEKKTRQAAAAAAQQAETETPPTGDETSVVAAGDGGDAGN